MTKVKKVPRDTTKLTGRPLPDTLAPSSILHTENEQWTTSPDLEEDNLPYTPGMIDNMTLYLLANPNRMSSHLFRADVLFDSWGVLSTPEQKERFFADAAGGVTESAVTASGHGSIEPIPARQVPGIGLSRTVVRRLIPRNPNLDKPLDQTCHFYVRGEGLKGADDKALENEGSVERLLVVYTPHIATKKDLPWYHPLLQSWALLYDYHKAPTPASSVAGAEETTGRGQLSLHFLLYPDEEIPDRLERTLHALINTQLRLARGSSLSAPSDMLPEGGTYKPSKDNVIPQHLVQNTYLRLKLKYAPDLHKKWVEDTDPSKHVFEDLAIAAFLVELWRSMYGVVPGEERGGERSLDKEGDGQQDFDVKFPGFVDVACGNGVLVYLLLMEGYQGWGFDARQRKTWKIFPGWAQERLQEEVYVPRPFADVLGTNESGLDIGVKTHTGMFPEDTFIVSNHADELTVWTPLLAALANPQSPLPFLAIPCCSHSLSGARYRYPPPKENGHKPDKDNNADVSSDQTDPEVEQNPQPASGDLKALRSAKIDAQTIEAGMNKSMYGSLTAKTMSVAEDIGYGVEKTMLRMPSTRNMGVLGGRRRIALARHTSTETDTTRDASPAHVSTAQSGIEDSKVNSVGAIVEYIEEIVRRECAREGGVEVAGKIWMERVKGLHQGKGSSQRH